MSHYKRQISIRLYNLKTLIIIIVPNLNSLFLLLEEIYI